MESLKVQLPDDLQEATKAMITDSLDSAVKEIQIKNSFPPYLNKGEASAYCGVSRGVFNAWLKKYDIPTIQIEGVSRFRREALDDFMKQHEQ
ncbi:helix-turn-helix domain-containing protein [Limosilactobacillus fastidiosus]|uniref:Helix-turn-helix domain-containing protein n=1 Tax=Limosilactobacillus fastidiosus TaxID=2759855 RepID=A0A7W3YD23_9LACO|nr:helix-turn-helix domain-containing protein [Limosilactobacillus fastidiosus]MBB1086820.1 helix-turn-helix domain-containing protein [Limosilactobacillus fastidiosus]MCD7085453.1 helix-turn-helix domain-containing protein [Limosilactobacillus fastidiosus]MCD7114684.1 helix-turn-helix domain-containing protein [Limosilactobacillus fastidiosus]MCD7116067.1 helix-turn-helix domain-containing protein [Limosilactobacillus fastidiosus]